MAKHIQETKNPEEQELEEKLAELSSLQEQLAQKELEFATLTSELHAFEANYLRTVGRKFAELDELNARIAGLIASRTPADLDAETAAKEARQRANESAGEARVGSAASGSARFVPTQELQELYRDIAKRVHPDLAVDDADRLNRNHIMAEVNHAYSEGDKERLLAILREWQSAPDTIEGEDVGARLVRTIRMIARVRSRIGEIEREMRSQAKTDLHRLKEKFDTAQSQGRDFFNEMVTELDVLLQEANARLRELQSEERGIADGPP